MSSHTRLPLDIMFQTLDIDPTTPNIKIRTTHHQITQPFKTIKILLISGQMVSGGMF